MRALDLPIYLYQLEIELLDRVRIGPVVGQQLHSVLSEGLRDAACLRLDDPARDCRNCGSDTPALHRQCTVPPILDPQVYLEPLRSARGIGTAPAPFILAAHGADFPPTGTTKDIDQGSRLRADLTLFGRANAELPRLVAGIRLSGWRRRFGGRSADRAADGARPGRYALRSVTAQPQAAPLPPTDGEVAASPPITLFGRDGVLSVDRPSVTGSQLRALAARIAEARRVVFRTASPLRIRVGKRYPDPLDGALLLTRLRDRAEWITFFHAAGLGATSPPPEQPVLLPANVKFSADTRLVEAHRSGRRPAHGLTGTLCFDAEVPGALAPIAPILAIAPWIGCGLLASMGFGRLVLVDLQS